MIEDRSVQASIGNRRLTRATQMLSGIVAGILADGHLHDLEVRMLRTWLAEHNEVTAVWPGSAVAKLLEEVLSDGVIDEAERTHLIDTLQQVCSTDFAATGSVTAEVGALPFDNDAPVDLRDQTVCHTGQFLYGTRKACEQLSTKAGGFPVSGITRKVDYLIVGTHVSADWINESYGRKIMQALDLRERGHRIAIIHERRWLEALDAV